MNSTSFFPPQGPAVSSAVRPTTRRWKRATAVVAGPFQPLVAALDPPLRDSTSPAEPDERARSSQKDRVRSALTMVLAFIERSSFALFM